MTRLPALALAAALIVAPLAAPPTSASGQSADQLPSLISVEFRGGSAAEYVEAIRRAAEEVNILVDPGLSDVPMPPLTLTHVSTDTALELLESRVHEGRDGTVRVRVQRVRNVPHEVATFQVRAELISGRQRPTDAGVLSIREITESGIAAEAVIDAIKVALEVAGSPTKADIRYHKETGLVIARGDVSQLATVDQVIARLRDSVDEDRETRARHDLRSALLEIQGLTQRLEQLERELHRREVELQETRKRLADTLTQLEVERGRRGGS